MNEHTTEIDAGHQHCEEGACESCDCCAAGWCINFADGSPWDDFLASLHCYTPQPQPGDTIWEHHREVFDTWCEIAVESRGFTLRPIVIPPERTTDV